MRALAGSRTSGRNLPVWLEGLELPEFSPLRQHVTADVCVVGAGFAGLTTAYLLRRQGHDVALIEDGRVGSGESGRTTAHLTVALDERWWRLEELHGETGARLAAESHASAIERVESLVRDEEIDCDFARVDGFLFAARPEHVRELERERDAARRAGLAEVDLVARAPAGPWDTGPALRFPRQARLNPARYLAGLARAFLRAGGRLYGGTHVEEIVPGRPARIAAAHGGEVVSPAVVIATNAPISDRFRLPTRQAAYRTYVVGLPIRHGSFGPQLLWDTDEPYHYVRSAAGKNSDLLLVGGEDHKTGQAEDLDARFDRLEHWARTRFAITGERASHWSGQVMEPVDGLAYIGPDPEDTTGSVFVVTGHSGNGTTYGTIAGMLLAEKIEGRRSRWADVYDPSRHSLRAAPRWAEENLNVVPEYAEWVTGGDVDDTDAIAPGQGAVLRKGLAKIAVYRDRNGGRHTFSAVCPHLGCLVHWNGAEKSWDCPCHGSRFDAMGTVVNGPAARDLEKG